MHAESSTNLGQRQTRLVELNGMINLGFRHRMSAHRRAGIAQKPEHTAPAEPVPLRELSRMLAQCFRAPSGTEGDLAVRVRRRLPVWVRSG